MPYEEDYKMWLEEALISMNPDWICDEMSDNEFTHDWCYKYCGEDDAYITPKCLHMYYHHIERDRKDENCSEKPNNSTISKMEQVDKDINVRSKTEPQTAECPFDDNIPCEWVCTEYANCKCKPQTDYKKWDAPPKVDLPTGEITTCVSVLASALEDEPTISKMEQVETMSCEECKHYGTNYPCELDFKACRYEPKTEPQTDCSWK